MHRVLFVCLGNLCRSPLALASLEGLVERRGLTRLFQAESAGTHAHTHIGQRPDARAIQVAARRGYANLTKHRARCVQASDFLKFDLIIAMDSSNLASLRKICPVAAQYKLHLLLEFATDAVELDIPDPYYSSLEGFERVWELCEAGVVGLVDTCMFDRGTVRPQAR